MKTIDLENHFITDVWVEALRNNKGYPTLDEKKGLGFAADAWMPMAVEPKLRDLGEGRIKLMDAAGVDYAVLSVTSPGAEQFEVEVGKEVARESNDILAEVMKKYPDRFGGFASLAPKDPEWSAQELERCVKELGFSGWNTHSNYGDSCIDEQRYWPLLAKAQELDVPIYLHPAVPMIPELRSFGMVLGGPTFGFGVEVMYAFMRMIVRGVFDEFPNLKIIMGHYGEAMPFLVDRVDRAYMQRALHPQSRDRPGEQGVGQPLCQEEPLGHHQRQLPAGSLRLYPGWAGDGQDPPGHRLPLRGHERLHGIPQEPAPDGGREDQALRGQRPGSRVLGTFGGAGPRGAGPPPRSRPTR